MRFYYWCDATTVLDWLGQYDIKKVFVNNRVNKIREYFQPVRNRLNIYHVPGDMNPTNIISRKQEAKDFIGDTKIGNFYPEEIVTQVMVAAPTDTLLILFISDSFKLNLVRLARVLRLVARTTEFSLF